MSNKLDKNRSLIIIYIFLGLGVLVTVVPFIWMFLTSIKTYEQAIAVPPIILPEKAHWINYLIIMEKFPFITLYINTIVVIVCVIIGQLIISSLAAYAFARLNFPAKDFLFLMILALLMIPSQIFLIPHYKIMIWLKSTDTLRALIMPSLFNAFGVFMLRQFYMSIPKSLDEAATIDGCSYFRIYSQILLPLLKPGLVSLSIITALNTWKALMWPLIVNRSIEKMTLSAGLGLLIGEHTTYYEQVMAGGVISVFPMLIIFVIFQKNIVEGIANTGIKN
ncbi:MAG: carbohydrate ABC transporter permease [Pleomorphochaeta sp.]